MVLPKPQTKCLYLTLCILRLVIFLPIFFLYIEKDLGFVDDYFIIIAISLFSMTSGFLGTSGYQLAPRLLESDAAKATGSNMLTLSFNGGCVISLGVAALVLK